MKAKREMIGELTRENLHRHIRVDDETGCWLWIKGDNGIGYGIKKHRGLAAEYGVRQSHISRLVRGVRWKHVAEESATC